MGGTQIQEEMKKLEIDVSMAFLLFAILALLFGAIAGVLGSIQYLEPQYLKEYLPFNRLREMHVSSMVSWIILASVGGIYFYIPYQVGVKWRYKFLPSIHLLIYILTAVGIMYSLTIGRMGGREYMAFMPWLMIPIVAGWILMAFNYFSTLYGKITRWPVYLWMWGTGLVFMIFHLTEANLWLFDHFRQHFVRDLTVQWKAYGSITGSWNLLVYGTAIFLMSKLKDESLARSRTAFFFYFLGLTNLMLGWAHHIYPVPGVSWIRGLAYVISMTEWIVLATMLTNWLKSISKSRRKDMGFVYTFLLITDIWVFFNVLLALLISIPAINQYTHGTHITVAHSMGTTIGINTSILFASMMFIVNQIRPYYLRKKHKWLMAGTWIYNLSLLVFLNCLFFAGVVKGRMMLQEGVFHAQIMEAITPYMDLFHWAGGVLAFSFFMLTIPLLRPIGRRIFG
jgi:nitric oxide reductase subunit B